MSAPTRRITSTDATASADSSTNTPSQRDGWIYDPTGQAPGLDGLVCRQLHRQLLPHDYVGLLQLHPVGQDPSRARIERGTKKGPAAAGPFLRARRQGRVLDLDEGRGEGSRERGGATRLMELNSLRWWSHSA